MDDTVEKAKELAQLLKDLNIGYNFKRLSIPGVLGTNVFVIEFTSEIDLKYICWNVLDNVSDDYFSKEVNEMLRKFIDGEMGHTVLHTDEPNFIKLYNVLVTLIDEGVINEWQASRDSISAMEALAANSPKEPEWLQKYHAVKHIEMWSADLAIEVVSGIINTLMEEHKLNSEALFQPFDSPYLVKFAIGDAEKGILLFRRVRCHDKFKDMDNRVIVGVEDLVTTTPEKGQGIYLTMSYGDTERLRDILVDL
jgi:hypothetical protein